MELGIHSILVGEAPHLKMDLLVQKVMRIGRRTQTPILV
jgi:hypothetical protein